MKVVEFKDYKPTDADVEIAIGKILEEKLSSVSVHGMYLKMDYVKWYAMRKNVDYEGAKADKKILKIIEENYNESLSKKKATYEAMRNKADFILHDVKSYKKLLETIDEFTYCGATVELSDIISRHVSGRSASKAIYRARLQEYSKVKCS